jgi:hypothetical protein
MCEAVTRVWAWGVCTRAVWHLRGRNFLTMAFSVNGGGITEP